MKRRNSTHKTTAAPWHAMEVDEVFGRLASVPQGLSAHEAARRLEQYGPNRLSPTKKRGPFIRFLEQFHNMLIYVLLMAAFATALLGHGVDAGVIWGVVLLNALIGFIQEGKAEKALEAIRTMLSLDASVLRDGTREVVPAEALAPGDIVFLQSGDKVPADVRLFQVKDLRLDESVLTGESAQVEKAVNPVEKSAIVGDRKCMAFSGTLVTFGQGTGLVVATGDSTEIGRIHLMIRRVQPLTTRLLRQIAQFGRFLTVAILALAAVTVLFGLLVRDYAFRDIFMAAVGLAVAAIPEGLPAIITITLAIGVQRMARRNAVIRRLPAVETLGAVTVICSDKTGTLTKNEMTVQTIATAEDFFEVTGVGYDPHGGFRLDGKEVFPSDYPVLMEIVRAGMLCNDSMLRQDDGQWRIQGDPTEGALMVLAQKANLDPSMVTEQFPRSDVIPFESEHRFMATLHHDHAGHGFIYLKGAPERVLEMCNSEWKAGETSPLNPEYWESRIAMLAKRGERTLAVAFKAAEHDKRELNFSDVEGGMTFVGLYGLMDPPREDAIAAVRLCKSAGIGVKMITGDHALTAQAIGAQMAIGDGEESLTGRELETMGEEALGRAVRGVDIFARVTPEHKLRIVQALQGNGEVVAMTGDGVNDAPALKRADIGIAMGIKGTEVAKEASEMVLADDNFASIAHAVVEGRTVYDNIKKAITFILPTNGGEAGMVIAAIIAGSVLPITPVQILWVNMITAVTLALSLAFEPPEKGVMRRPPRSPQEPILSSFLIWRIVFVSGVMVAGTFGLFLWDRLHEMSIAASRTVAVNTLVLFEVFYLLNTRYLREPVLSGEGLFGNKLVHVAIGIVVAAQLVFTYASPMQALFGTAALGIYDWIRVAMVSASVFLLVEGEKHFLHRIVKIQSL
jgi:magnesium-transporting ATPase (P-type)